MCVQLVEILAIPGILLSHRLPLGRVCVILSSQTTRKQGTEFSISAQAGSSSSKGSTVSLGMRMVIAQRGTAMRIIRSCGSMTSGVTRMDSDKTLGIQVRKFYLHWGLKSVDITYIGLLGSPREIKRQPFARWSSWSDRKATFRREDKGVGHLRLHRPKV